LLINGAPRTRRIRHPGQLSGAIPRQHDPAAAGSAAAGSATPQPETLPTCGPPTNTLDLIVENLADPQAAPVVRPKPNAQRKGLASWQSLNAEQLQAPGRLLINEQPVPSYKIYSLRLDAAFMAKVAEKFMAERVVCRSSARRPAGIVPASLRLMDEPLADTYLDMSAWRKGVAFVNGFNLGRYWTEAGRKGHCIPARHHCCGGAITRQSIRSTRGLWEQLNQLERLLPAALLQSRRHLSSHRLDWWGGSLRPESAQQHGLAATNSGPCLNRIPHCLRSSELNINRKQGFNRLSK
uniref:Glyco_hydro_35 domain-containing protein n=1 Tax=Macrostomum lignano TaxID=282301 RepID=A0A1I8FI65_9PLAT